MEVITVDYYTTLPHTGFWGGHAPPLRRLANVLLTRPINELSRNRTYIRNLEGFCPDPLDDEPIRSYKTIMC